jgi:hypothetical protein
MHTIVVEKDGGLAIIVGRQCCDGSAVRIRGVRGLNMFQTWPSYLFSNRRAKWGQIFALSG